MTTKPPFPIFENLRTDFTDWIRGPSYETAYPQINKRNHFSISTLSFSVDKQVDWKLEGKKEKPDGKISTMMFNGKAKHEYLLGRWRDQNPPYRRLEYELNYRILHDWKNHPFKDIVLLGHIDGLEIGEGYFIELKTTDWGGPKISDYARLQAGTYGFILAYLTKEFYTPVIIKTNSEVNYEVMTSQDCAKAMVEMERRAHEAAERVDI